VTFNQIEIRNKVIKGKIKDMVTCLKAASTLEIKKQEFDALFLFLTTIYVFFMTRCGHTA